MLSSSIESLFDEYKKANHDNYAYPKFQSIIDECEFRTVIIILAEEILQKQWYLFIFGAIIYSAKTCLINTSTHVTLS